MITLLRFNTFLHVFTLFGILLLFKMPLVFHGLPVLSPEVEWQLIGERLTDGKILYQEIWTDVGPLSAYSYGLFTWLFGRSTFRFEILATLIVFFQALYLNYSVNKRGVLLERTFVPALFYVLLMSLSFDSCKLSPALLGNTFLLFALNSFFKHIDSGEGTSQHTFEVGLFIGIGTLFVYSYPLFLLWAFISLILFTPFKSNQLFLLFLGFAMPLIVALLFFYFVGSAQFFMEEWGHQLFRIGLHFDQSTITTVLLFAVPSALAILGAFQVFNYPRYANFQTRKHQALMVYGLFAVLNYIFSRNSATFCLLGLTPFLAIFTSGYFLHMRGTYRPELLFLTYALMVAFLSFQGVQPVLGNGFSYLEALRIDKGATPAFARGQRILVTGGEIDSYFEAKLGSVYLNWDVSKAELGNADVYQHIASIFHNFEKEKPIFIIDKAAVFPDIFERIPELKAIYEPKKGEQNVYELKANNQ